MWLSSLHSHRIYKTKFDSIVTMQQVRLRQWFFASGPLPKHLTRYWVLSLRSLSAILDSISSFIEPSGKSAGVGGSPAPKNSTKRNWEHQEFTIPGKSSSYLIGPVRLTLRKELSHFVSNLRVPADLIRGLARITSSTEWLTSQRLPVLGSFPTRLRSNQLLTSALQRATHVSTNSVIAGEYLQLTNPEKHHGQA